MVYLVTILFLGVALVCSLAAAAATVCLYANVTPTKIYRGIILKVLVKLKKSPTDCLRLLAEVYCEDVMSRTLICLLLGLLVIVVQSLA